MCQVGQAEAEDEEMEEVDSDEWEEFEDDPIPTTGRFFLYTTTTTSILKPVNHSLSFFGSWTIFSIWMRARWDPERVSGGKGGAAVYQVENALITIVYRIS